MRTKTSETPRQAACETTRGHIARLVKMLETELADHEMREDTWPVAGSLGYIRELLSEAVGHLKGVEGSEIVNAMINRRTDDDTHNTQRRDHD